MTTCIGIKKNGLVCNNKQKYGNYCGIHKLQRVIVEQPNDILGYEEFHECSICLDDIGDNKVKLDCNHHFHQNCIKSWYNRKHNCPLCRKIIIIRNMNKLVPKIQFVPEISVIPEQFDEDILIALTIFLSLEDY